jgi:hypothetical protein
VDGKFAPHAASGELVVSGLRVSCYTTALHPAAAHAVVAALAAAPRSVLAATQAGYDWAGTGVRTAARWLHPVVGGRMRYDAAPQA